MVLERAKKRLEEEILQKALQLRKRFLFVQGNVQKMRQREKDRIEALRDFAVSKEVRCKEFLSTRVELLDRRGAMRHDLLMQKAGWSLLSTAKKELEVAAAAIAELRAQKELEEEAAQVPASVPSPDW